MANQPQLFNLDTETIDILKDCKNKSKFVREAIKNYARETKIHEPIIKETPKVVIRV